jgi:hypothetical protein
MSVSPAFVGEYRRDVGRHVKGEMDTYPLLPLDYFEEKAERSLRRIEGTDIAPGEVPRRGLCRAQQRPNPQHLAQRSHPHLPRLARALIQTEAPRRLIATDKCSRFVKEEVRVIRPLLSAA